MDFNSDEVLREVIPAAASTNKECSERDQLLNKNDGENIAPNKNLESMMRELMPLIDFKKLHTLFVGFRNN